MRLELEASAAALRLQSNDAGWCRVELQLGDGLRVLGAEMQDKVVAGLIDGLRDVLVGNIAGAVDGHPVRWILSLAEPHCAVYGAEVDACRRLYFQDRDAVWIATVTLSSEERAHWLSVLQRVG